MCRYCLLPDAGCSMLVANVLIIFQINFSGIYCTGKQILKLIIIISNARKIVRLLLVNEDGVWLPMDES